MKRRRTSIDSIIRELLQEELRACPAECGVVAITEIAVSPDGKSATVSLSALRDTERALRWFERRRASLQRRLAALHLPRMPLLRFRRDPRSERGARVEELLRDAEAGRKSDW